LNLELKAIEEKQEAAGLGEMMGDAVDVNQQFELSQKELQERKCSEEEVRDLK